MPQAKRKPRAKDEPPPEPEENGSEDMEDEDEELPPEGENGSENGPEEGEEEPDKGEGEKGSQSHGESLSLTVHGGRITVTVPDDDNASNALHKVAELLDGF